MDLVNATAGMLSLTLCFIGLAIVGVALTARKIIFIPLVLGCIVGISLNLHLFIDEQLLTYMEPSLATRVLMYTLPWAMGLCLLMALVTWVMERRRKEDEPRQDN